MTLRTGNKRGSGFTLIEVMVTTVILSLSVVLIYEIFFRSLDALNYCCDYFKVVAWADDRMWQAQNELTRFNTLTETPTSDILVVDNKNFTWNVSYVGIGGVPCVYRIDGVLSWREGRKDMKISRMAYARYDQEKK